MANRRIKNGIVRRRVAKRNLKSTLNEGIFSKAKDKVKGLFKKNKQKEEPKKLENVTPDKYKELVSYLKPMSALKYLASFDDEKPSKYFIKNLPKILFRTFKKMGSNIGDFFKSVKNASEKTNDDKTSKKNFSDLDIDPKSATMKCMFDGEVGRKMSEFFKQMGIDMDREQEAVEKELTKQAQEQIKKDTGVKLDEKTVGKDPILAVEVAKSEMKPDQPEQNDKTDNNEKAENGDNTKKQKSTKSRTTKKPKPTAKTLKKKINDTAKVMTEMKNIVKEAKKRAEKYKKSPIGRKTGSDSKKLKTRMNKILSKDYKNKYQLGVYKTENFKKRQLGSKQFKVILDKLDTKYMVGFIMPYNKKKTDAILKSIGEATVKQDKDQYGALNPISTTETKGIGNVSKEIEKVIRDYFKDTIKGKVYAYRRSNKDSFNNTTDSVLYVFCALKDYDKNLPSESDGDEFVDEAFGGNGTIMQKLANTVLGLFGQKAVNVTTTKQTARLVFDKAIEDMQKSGGGSVTDQIIHRTGNMFYIDTEEINHSKENIISTIEDRILNTGDEFSRERGGIDINIDSIGRDIQYDKWVNGVHVSHMDNDDTVFKSTNFYLKNDDREQIRQAFENSGTTTTEEDVGDYNSCAWILPIVVGLKILNKEKKNIVQFFGSQAIKFKEDIKSKNIAVVDFYADKDKYSLRYSLQSGSWVITKLDDRKAKIDDEFKNNVLNSEFISKFKRRCLSIWKPYFEPKDNKSITNFQYLLVTYKTLGIKDKDIEVMKEMNDKYNKIVSDFQ